MYNMCETLLFNMVLREEDDKNRRMDRVARFVLIKFFMHTYSHIYVLYLYLFVYVNISLMCEKLLFIWF
jgi:hypothetical protein